MHATGGTFVTVGRNTIPSGQRYPHRMARGWFRVRSTIVSFILVEFSTRSTVRAISRTRATTTGSDGVTHTPHGRPWSATIITITTGISRLRRHYRRVSLRAIALAALSEIFPLPTGQGTPARGYRRRCPVLFFVNFVVYVVSVVTRFVVRVIVANPFRRSRLRRSELRAFRQETITAISRRAWVAVVEGTRR